MDKQVLLLISFLVLCSTASTCEENTTGNFISSASSSINCKDIPFPLGIPGETAEYHLVTNTPIPASAVEKFTLSLGPAEEKNGLPLQWIQLQSSKAIGAHFQGLGFNKPVSFALDGRRKIDFPLSAAGRR